MVCLHYDDDSCVVTGKIVAVLAFTTAYKLEAKRRDNEKKIVALYVQMKDMMGVLLLCVQVFTHYNMLYLWSFSLKNVKNDELVAPDGRSIEDRWKPLVERTANDIKSCSSVCDTYAKKGLLAKIFKSPIWNDKLLSWATRFSERRKEFELELSIHINQGVDKANDKLNAIDEKFEYPFISFGCVLNRDTG